ncbi:hypothetical protein ACLB2K_003382 [Fragaria x ananassa]
MQLQQVQVYTPALGEQQPEMMSVDECQSIGDLDDSQLVGAHEAAAALVAVKEVRMGEVAAEVKEPTSSVGKKRRGRPPGPGRPKTTQVRKKNDEEDVCFICFDGGSLVLCDRRGCPKAYHPSCIKRDEAFFKSKARWNCGWHICSSCQKASHYMCYTCTYSLCKGCIKDADYQCVRGNKGFCGTCMRTIMLIENVQGNKEAAQVDFDDKSSWEYLFKVYWILLKGQLSLTVDDLIKAKNPWKGAAVVACPRGASGEVHVGHKTNDLGSLNSCVDLGAANSNGSNKRPRIGDGGMSLPEGTNWASKELLEFVAYMKNGDVSVLSQFGVQALMLEYIKKNNLRDPHRKGQIICDTRLRNLFGKECVGHFEMLKLLEYHYLIKECPTAENNIGAGVLSAVATDMEIDVSSNQLMMCSDKRRKTHKIDERVPPTNPDAYAAIDAHNINLIYLRRNLLENLLDDVDKFNERIVGSIVRIRISSSDQKHDSYRLVQVIGTSKVAEGYKVGTRTTDMKLEISNLDKREVLPIDQISDQEFSQDECKQLRQSIKRGLIKRFTVGEIQDKAMALRAIRVNDELAAEVLRLNHLRDRASENGRRKEFVEKLQCLDSPEERQRRLGEVPEVHTDPEMDPSYESEDNAGEDNKQDGNVKTRKSVSGRKGRESFSPQMEGGVSNNSGNKAQNNQLREALGINGSNTTTNQATPTGLVRCGGNDESAVESNISSKVASENLSVSFSAVMKANLPVESFEMQKIWHYQDPSGKIQGPFAMVQLCKWDTTGVFPPDHRIWRINEKQDDSILLTDALKGQYCKKPLLPHDSNIQSQGLKVALDGTNSGLDGRWNNSINATPIDGKKVEESWNTKKDGQIFQNSGNSEVVRSSTPADAVNSNEKKNGEAHNSGRTEVLRSSTPADAVNSNEKQIGTHNSCSTEVARSSTPADAVNSDEKQTGFHLQGCDSVKIDTSLSNRPQECSSLTSPVLSVKPYETLSHQEGEGTTENNSNQKNGSVDWRQNTQDQMNKEQGNENRSDSEGQSVQSSAQNWTHPPASSPSNGCDFTSDFVPVAKTFETSDQDERELDFPDFRSHTPKRSNGDSRGQASEHNQSLSSNLAVQDGGHSWSDSNLVGGGEQLQKVAGDWGGYSPTPAKPSVEEWDSSLVSASSLKPSEIPSDFVAAPVSVNGQLTEPIPSHPTSNASSWQEILTETNEFCTLAADESVSDLLAEVEAMESLCGLATPTSIMHCGGEFTEGSKNDSCCSVEGFSPAPEPGKGDALSSTCDLQLPSEAMVTDEPLGVSQASILDLQQTSGVCSSTSPELQGDRKPSDVAVKELEANVSVDQLEAGEIKTAAPSKECWDMSSTDDPWKARLESTGASIEAVQGNTNTKWEGSDPGGTKVLDLQQMTGVLSSKSTEAERKPSNVSVNQLDANVSVNQLEPGDIPMTAPSKESWCMSATDNPWKARLESRDASCEAIQGNVNAGWGGDQGSTNRGWGGPDPGSANVGWRGGQGSIQGNTVINSGAPAGGMWEGQSRYGGDRRGRGFPNRDVGFGRGRFAGDRQASYGNRNGGSFRQPPRGQRVCKYYESGYCKKGASCSYLHP